MWLLSRVVLARVKPDFYAFDCEFSMSSLRFPHAFVACSDLSFVLPDGTSVFDGLSLSVDRGRTGLVGANGSGKTTLFRLLSGDVLPTRGSVSVQGRLAYLPQNVTLDTDLRVDQVLGIEEKRAALHAIESGEIDQEHFTVVGDDWDVEERALAGLAALGLGHVDLDRTVGRLSGGESVLLCLVALLMERPDVLLLDEPTNNLDLFARRRLYEAVDSWSGGALIVSSHDRDLLERVDRIAELRAGSVHWYGGGWSSYRQALTVHQQAAERTLSSAQADVRRQKRELEEARDKLARRQREGKKKAAQGGIPKIVAGGLQRSAQESAGKMRGVHQDRLHKARQRQQEAAEAVRKDSEICVDLPETTVPSGRDVLRLSGLCLGHGLLCGDELLVRGPERIALVGRNGSGKTTLLRAISGDLVPWKGQARALVPLRFLPQRLDVLQEEQTVLDNVARLAPQAGDQHIRAQLARFLFRGRRTEQLVKTLSGGERFRATLAALLLATPAPQLLLLDEPTNNLDLPSVRQLTGALEAYRGAVLVASHDLSFLESIGVTRWLLLDEQIQECSVEEVRARLTQAQDR